MICHKTQTIFYLFSNFLLVSTSITIDSKSTEGTTYKINNGVSRKGTPFQHLLVKESLDCIMNCKFLLNCQAFNLISNGNGRNYSCELFNQRTNDEAYLSESENAAYYEVLRQVLQDCPATADANGNTGNGIYTVTRQSHKSIKVYCDTETAQGGWILLQRRVDGSIVFQRDWQSYKDGFGDLNGEFWLGLDAAHQLMEDGSITLRFDLWNGGDHSYQEYYEATIENEANNYRLQYTGNAGTAGDSMTMSENQMFTTTDRDNDVDTGVNCAALYSGGWWYSACHSANLNGIYGSTAYAKGVNWGTITDFDSSLTKTEIKIKRNG